MSKKLAECQRVIGYAFANPSLLEIALTHSSVRTPDRECNERQEFLGDSVLGLAITEELYKRLPDQQEGELTRIKSAVVSRGALYRVSTKLGLTQFVDVAKGVARRDELPVSLTANLVESIIGAVYLDGGFYPAREFILRHLGPEIEDVFNDRVPKNFKSLLQHEAQQLLNTTPVYRCVEEEGPDHRRLFTVAAILKGTEYGRASGINKKEAEQEAARHALEALKYRGRRRRRRLPELRDPRDRDRDRVARIATQSKDPDDWREWAEAAAKPAGPTSYAIAPEADEGFFDEGAAGAPPIAPEADADFVAPDDAPAPAADAAPAADDAAPREDAPSEEAGDGRRRRGRRGRRGSGRSKGAAADAGADGPPAPSAEEVPAAFVEAPPHAEPASAPSLAAEAPSWPDGPADPEPPRERRPRGGRGRGRRSASGAATPDAGPADAAPPPEVAEPPPSRPAPAAPAAPSGPSFGAGVVGGDSPPPPPRKRAPAAEVTPTVEVEGRRKAPVAPKKPPADGGFGVGL